MNQVIKNLTIFILLTFIAVIYGMSFIYMPELEWWYGYAIIWAVIVATLNGMLFFFKRKNWF